jgi:pyruvate ferredoxin oxidoreductase beta subunit
MNKTYNLKKEVEKPVRLTGGHRLCAGCGAGIVTTSVLRAMEEEDKAVVTNATGCLEVSTFMYPYTAYTDSLFILPLKMLQLPAPERKRPIMH